MCFAKVMNTWQSIYSYSCWRFLVSPKNRCSAKFHTSKIMAKSKFDYVKLFETDDKLLPNCWMVVRLDGKAFHKFADSHGFCKPNDKRALDLMNKCAITVMDSFRDIVLSFGQSDEYSFVFQKDTVLYSRRESKILTTVNSLFSSAYVYNWNDFFGSVKLQYPPSFDARIVLYPSDDNLRDYLCWRQADVHINNLYNTVFWSLVQTKNLTPAEAQERLRGTLSSHKNEILFSEFGINYNKEPEMFRKGTTYLKKLAHCDGDCSKLKKVVLPFYCDFFQEKFWKEHSDILCQSKPQTHYVVNDSDSSNIQCKVCEKSNKDSSKSSNTDFSENSKGDSSKSS